MRNKVIPKFIYHTIGNDKVGDFQVCTTYTADYGYETSLSKGDKEVVVARYDTKEEALSGHEDWYINAIYSPVRVYSIDDKNYISL